MRWAEASLRKRGQTACLRQQTQAMQGRRSAFDLSTFRYGHDWCWCAAEEIQLHAGRVQCDMRRGGEIGNVRVKGCVPPRAARWPARARARAGQKPPEERARGRLEGYLTGLAPIPIAFIKKIRVQRPAGWRIAAFIRCPSSAGRPDAVAGPSPSKQSVPPSAVHTTHAHEVQPCARSQKATERTVGRTGPWGGPRPRPGYVGAHGHTGGP